jgi:hypothetical protein
MSINSTNNAITTTGYLLIDNGLANTQIYLPRSSGDVYGTIQTESGGSVFSLGVTSLTLPALGTPVITWTSGLQVGINTLSPTKDFDVNGTAKVRGIFTLGSTLSNGTYFYTLPSATGTLALTSNLSSYLPLTGGTLTGQLYINPTNTAITGLDVASDNISFRSDNLEGFKRQLLITMGSGTLIQFTAKGYGANYGTDLAFYTATTSGVNSSPAMYITSGNKIGILNGTPTATFDVTGSGAFSSTLDATIFNSTSNSYRLSGNTAISLTTISSQTLIKMNAAGYWGVQLVGANDTGITIGSTGNVAINQSPPPSNVKFKIRSSDQSSSNYAFLIDNSIGDLIEIRNDGLFNVGLAANSPYNYNVTFSPRTAGLDASGGLGYIVSTRESKDNIESLKNIDYINKLNPVSFNYRKKNNDNTEYIDEVYEDIYFGFIADEVEQINKDLVFYDNLKDGTKKLAGVHYNSVIAILTKAIQEVNEKLVRNNIN